MNNIKNFLKQVDFLKATEYSIEEIGGGWTNKNYKITTNNNCYLIRLTGEDTNLFIDRHIEIKNMQIASKYGICKPILFHDSEFNTIREFIEGNEITDWTNENISLCANTLKKLHNIPESFVNKRNFFEETRHYLKIIEQKCGYLPKNYLEIKKILKKIEKQFLDFNIKLVPCHCDPNGANFIKNDKNINLLDFEYAGNNDPICDLAYLACHLNFDKDKEQIIINSYFEGNETNEEMQRFNLYKPVIEIIFAVWSRMQISIGKMPIDKKILEQYENEALETLKRFL